MDITSDNDIIIPESHKVSSNLEMLAGLAAHYAKASKSKNTHKAYRSDWSDFEFWCSSRSLTALPANPETVAAYLSDRATNEWSDKSGVVRPPLKTSSLSRRLSTISQAHKAASLPFNRNHPIISETWKGIQNTLGTSQKRKAPILVDDLRAMIKAIPIEKKGRPYIKGIRDRALLLIGFAGAFRRSELVSLHIEDLKWQKEGIITTLRKSKTDQSGRGRDVAIPYGSNPLTCPVRSLQHWLEISKIESGPLFRPVNRHGHISDTPLSTRPIETIIKSNPHIQEKIEEFSGHSLRSGFVTTAAIAGIAEHKIMRQTGHKRSDTIKKYIRIGSIWKENAAFGLGL